MKDNHEILVLFFKDGLVTISNFPNQEQSEKYTFTSVDYDKYRGEKGEKKLKIKVFYNGLNVEKTIKLQWKGLEVIYIHLDVESLEDYYNIEEYKDYIIYFVKERTPVKEELLGNLVSEIGYKELIDEILKLKKDILNLNNESQLQ